MGYLNNVTDYHDDLLANHAIIEHDNFALLTSDRLVKGTIPGSESCDVTILSAPKLGASFVNYLVTLHQNDGDQSGFDGEGIETFVYTIFRKVEAKAEGKAFALTQGGYFYCPPGKSSTFGNTQTEDNQLFLYERRCTSVAGHSSWLVSGNANRLEHAHYEGMNDAILLGFLPEELGFSMGMHILSFEPDASHDYIEMHVQEHGAYTLSSQRVYNLDNQWIPVKKDDYIFMGAYSLQAGYDVGRGEALDYIYSKDCNRDTEI